MTNEDKVFQEAHRHFCLSYLKDEIHQAHYDAWQEFDYSPASNVTKVVRQAVKSALSRSYRDITGEDLFPEEDTLASVWNKVQADSKKLDDMLNGKAPF